MAKLGIYKPRQVVRALERAGWFVSHQTGSHVIMEKEGEEATLSIPSHKGRDVKRGTLAALLRDAGIKQSEFLDLLRK